MLSYNRNSETSPDGTVRYLQLLIGVATIVLVLFEAIFPFLSATKKVWHLGSRTATGVDAAEKGDTRHSLLAKVSYDLQKRAILHKAGVISGYIPASRN